MQQISPFEDRRTGVVFCGQCITDSITVPTGVNLPSREKYGWDFTHNSPKYPMTKEFRQEQSVGAVQLSMMNAAKTWETEEVRKFRKFVPRKKFIKDEINDN